MKYVFKLANLLLTDFNRLTEKFPVNRPLTGDPQNPVNSQALLVAMHEAAYLVD